YARRDPNVFVGGHVPAVGLYGYPAPRVVVERDYVVNRRPLWGASLGIGVPFFGFAFGSPPPPPPPVYIAPPPPPVVVYNPPQRYLPTPPPSTVVADPVANAMGRLSSSHDNSRRDGALTLGR